MKNLFLFSLLILVSTVNAQLRIDDSFEFQNDPAKKYSLYIPSDYQQGTPHRLMLGLHPLNTNRWDAQSWCDTLINFAENNNLILVCPDGGTDGAVDDPIDTAFTSVLLDSVALWYTVDPDKTYAMGFSWGGKTTYTYGLNHIDRFRGFMPIGAAVNVSEVNNVIQNANGKLYYLVHGSNDNPGVRYTPLLDALNDNSAITNSLLMPGVGHTIDFPNRNQILGDAFHWLDSVNCAQLTPVIDIEFQGKIQLFPNPVSTNTAINLNISEDLTGDFEVLIFDQKGALVYSNSQQLNRGANPLFFTIRQGLYFVSVKKKNKIVFSEKLIVY